MYAKVWIIRFQGKLTQGPNAGNRYTFAMSWGGAIFDTLEEAQRKLDEYRQREPHLAYQILSRQWIGGKRGRWQEELIASFDNGPGIPD